MAVVEIQSMREEEVSRYLTEQGLSKIPTISEVQRLAHTALENMRIVERLRRYIDDLTDCIERGR